jgi:hypothetical protein
MKKTSKRLVLRKDTVRMLSGAHLVKAAGASADSIAYTVCLVGFCEPTGAYDCTLVAGGGGGGGGGIGSGLTNDKCVRTD